MNNVPELRFSEFASTGSAQARPELRFKQDNGTNFPDWEEKRLGDYIDGYRLGGNYSNSENKTDFPLIKMGNLGRGEINLRKVEYITKNAEIEDIDRLREGDLLFNTRNTLDLVGKVSIWKSELPVAYYNSNIMKMDFKNNYFMNYRLNSFDGIKSLRRIATGTTSVAAIYTKDLLKIMLQIPCLEEQQKIATFLSAVDKKLGHLRRKHELLESYKRGVMQKIFAPFDSAQGKPLRFKQDNGTDFPDWEEKRLGDVFEEIKEKVGTEKIETYSITAGKGFISQKKKFGKDISGQQNVNYTKLKPFEFSYNKGNSKTFKYGCIYLNEEGKTISVPNVFISFKLLNIDMDMKFFAHLFNSHYLDRSLRRIISSSARMDGLLNVNKKNFFNLNIIVPPNKEQQKIANFLSTLDKKLETVQKQIDQTEIFKKGLLQKMFV